MAHPFISEHSSFAAKSQTFFSDVSSVCVVFNFSMSTSFSYEGLGTFNACVGWYAFLCCALVVTAAIADVSTVFSYLGSGLYRTPVMLPITKSHISDFIASTSPT